MSQKYIVTFLLSFISLYAYSQQATTISGTIYDSSGQQVLTGVIVRIKQTQIATTTNEDGKFSIQTVIKIPFTLIVTYVGFKEQELLISDGITHSLTIGMNPIQQISNEVVVSASRYPESLLKSPISIEKLDIRAIKQTCAPSFFDALENIKGVQMTTLSLTYKVPNTRGFSGTTNSRFLQLVDGIDNISPGIGAPIGNTIGPSDLDVESVELIPGASSALYGLNAVNGIANIKTKSPFRYEGISVLQRTGVNHIDAVQQNTALVTETAIRLAKVLNRRWAIKINADYNQGQDGIANNLRDQNSNANTSVNLTGLDNPGKDLVNVYGDEGSDRKTLNLNGKNYVISRTGYLEKDLADYHLKNWKGDIGLFYRFAKNAELSYSYRTGNITNLYQRGNRIQLNGLHIQQHIVSFQSKRLSIKSYFTQESTGKSYNLRALGENLDLAFKNNTDWFNDYKTAYLKATSNGQTDAQAHVTARSIADNGRLQPGSEMFKSKKEELIRINNWDKGAALVMNTGYTHFEGQYDFIDIIPYVQTLIGFNYRNYFIHPDGNSYINPDALNDASRATDIFNYYSYGGFLQLSKLLFDEQLKLVASIRADKAQFLDAKINPRVALVYTLTKNNNIRISYQNGYRFPNLFEGYSFVDNGGIKRLGGLPILASKFKVFENSYLRSSQDAFINAVNNDINKNASTLSTAIAKNKDILKKSSYSYIKPEHINSFEIGYRGTFLKDKFFIDVDYYFNVYKDFIGQVELSKPNNGIIGRDDSTIYEAYDRTLSKIYRMWTNSTSLVSNQGASIGITYNLYRKLFLNLNTSYAALVSISEDDALIPAFNTPKWITNVSIGNNTVTENFGFNLSYHWQSTFEWQSPLANGTISAYGTVGLQITYRIPIIFSTFKIGSNNLLNKKFYQYEGGPINDGLYYLTLTFDSPLKRKI